jgi:hypothetical protein
MQRYALFFLTPQTTVKQVVKKKGFILKRSGLGCYTNVSFKCRIKLVSFSPISRHKIEP